MERKWTKEQTQCLDARGTVLTSAAAGSGKTAVLVERIIRLITDPVAPVEVDSLLVVTFTKAAAAEMKQRLSVALTKAIAENPRSARLRRQLMLLPGAAISTVHGFCTTLIRENFHHIPDLSPQFRVAEESELQPLLNEAMSEMLEEAYRENSPAFAVLCDLLGGTRDDRRLRERILSLCEFIKVDPSPERWLEQNLTLYRDALPPQDTPHGQEILAAVKDTLVWCEQLYTHAIDLCSEDQSVSVYIDLLRAEREEVRRRANEAERADWDSLLQLLCGFSFDRLPTVRNCTDPALKERVSALRRRAKTKLEALRELMIGSAAEIRAQNEELAPIVSCLFALTENFDKRFTAKKRARDLVDFNDLEHLALQLLVERLPNGTWQRRPLADEISARFTHVMVDEYQDTNPAQDLLFRAVSQNEKNMFLVGDVKQSIYEFRNATPELFIAKRDRYAEYDGETYPAVIRLGHNFRSRQSVIDTVNFVFRQLMSRRTCGIDYDETEELRHAADYPPQEDEAAELLLIDTSDGCEEESETLEARAIAEKLTAFSKTLRVKCEEGDRPLAWGDVCILLRSMKGHAALYADELNRCGIPAVCGTGSGLYSSSEILTVLSLLRFLDNPLQDVALLAVLLSPVFGFSPDDLAEIRRADRNRPLFVSLRRRADVKDELGGRCRSFLRNTDRLRTLAAAIPADRLLAQLYEELALPAVLGARKNGAARIANLQKLQDIAHNFEQNGTRGLSAFVRFVDREAERDQSSGGAADSRRDAVRIMSIHSSKGLEFPVVFLAGLSQFNDQSERDALLLHRDLGVGMDLLKTDTMETYHTLGRQALIRRIHRDARAESLRVLYVAMTRARERLCMVVSGNLPALLQKAADAVTSAEVLPAGAVTEATRSADWILMSLIRHPDASLLRMQAQADHVGTLPCKSRMRITLPDVTKTPTVEQKSEAIAPPDEAYRAAVAERMAYRYPYTALSNVPVKLAASELAHRALQEQFIATARPAFLSESELTPAERGTALHQFMQFADYHAAAVDIATEADRLTRSGFLSAVQRRALPLPRLRRFFESELYRRICRSTDVRREYAFTLEVSAALCAELSKEIAAEETVLVQGIADCVFREGDGFVIVDYKTDRIKTAAELAERYRSQLALYAQALEAETGLPVRECVLYSFSLEDTVVLPREIS